MELEASYGAPHTGKVGMTDPDDVTRQIIEKNPDLSSARIAKELVAEAKSRNNAGDSDLLDSMLYSEAIRSVWRVQDKIPRAERRRVAAEEIKERKEKATKIVREGLSAIVSRLTVGEVRRFHKHNTKLIERLKGAKPSQIVGDILSIAELKRIGF